MCYSVRDGGMKDAVANWTGIMGIVAYSQTYDIDTSALSTCDDVGTQVSSISRKASRFILT
jgi:hypothetical protein